MSIGHNHHSSSNLGLVFFLNLIFSFLEFFGGYWTNSVAIYSDALHDFGDSIALGVAWYLQILSNRSPDQRFTYGYKRFSLLGAIISGAILITGSVYIIIESIQRILNPEVSHADKMILFAILGILVNGYAVFSLKKGKSMNERMISLHLMEDVLGWIAVLIAAIIMLYTDNQYIDPVLSLAIIVYILIRVIYRMKETLLLFLQGIPSKVDVKKIQLELLKIPLVHEVHSTNIWSLEGEHHVYTSHIKLKELSDFKQFIEVKKQIKKILKGFNFEHYTLELELSNEDCENLNDLIL